MRRLRSLILAGLVAVAAAAPAVASEEMEYPKNEWSHGAVTRGFSNIFGTFDRKALQRGFQVYKEVCSACHSMNLLSYRNLSALGYNEAEITAIAAGYDMTDGPNDEGEMFTRKGVPADHFKAPFPNEKAAAAANGGKAPPDLSLIVKARKGGEDYIVALMTGFEPAPAGFTVPSGGNYNKAFPGHVIAMPPPLSDGGVTYADGTKATVEQQAKDVATFLAWAAEPNLEARHEMGLKVMIFLIVLAGILYAAKRAVWADQH
ncbi:cytochrome c1 [Nitrospirillum pindoramense]|uniref:Cytochrome c1 n=1 Tax=Nitrospirillum amazonense TaxID=28077 RepID=A0A560HFP5_9PROT|nr:cytochrome c1 [Nitrospirillum amazonense]TWB45246.1 ubiquinol-cytochrome c reductase cytochrome c1 subunit [Nitrospirillum amazonense]